MIRYKRIAIVSLSLTVLLCFTYGHVTRVKGPRSEETAKEHTIQRIVNHIEEETDTLERHELRKIAEILYEESKRNDVDYRLILAIMKVESNFRHKAVSSRGARGLLQLKPSLARYIAKDAGVHWRGAKTLDEPDKNIRIGIHHLSSLLDDFESLNLALHAYHVGPTRLKELLSERNKLNKRFLNLVLKEYRRNISVLPDP